MSVSGNKLIVRAVLTGLAVTCVITILLTCVFGFVLKMTSGIPYGVIDYVMIGIEGIAVFLGAYIACVIAKSRGLVIGGMIGAAAFLILLCCGFILSENNIGMLTLIRAVVMILLGIVGGIAGVNKKEKVRIK